MSKHRVFTFGPYDPAAKRQAELRPATVYAGVVQMLTGDPEPAAGGAKELLTIGKVYAALDAIGVESEEVIEGKKLSGLKLQPEGGELHLTAAGEMVLRNKFDALLKRAPAGMFAVLNDLSEFLESGSVVADGHAPLAEPTE